MGATMSKVILVGIVGQEPKLINSGNESNAFMSCVIGTERPSKKSEIEEKGPKSMDFHKCMFFNQQAKFMADYVTKGSIVTVDGQLQKNKWTSKAGEDRWETVVIAQNIQLISLKSTTNEESQFHSPIDE